MFKVLVEEAKQRDLRVWIIDDAGYPSGFAGGLITSEKPELRMQALTIAQRMAVKGGETLQQAVAAGHGGGDGERMRRASGWRCRCVNGEIAWTAPAGGDWTVLVVEHVFRTSPTASATNLNAQEGHDAVGGGLYGSGGDDGVDPVHPRGVLQGDAGGVRQDDHWLSRRRAGLFDCGLPWTPKFFEPSSR